MKPLKCIILFSFYFAAFINDTQSSHSFPTIFSLPCQKRYKSVACRKLRHKFRPGATPTKQLSHQASLAIPVVCLVLVIYTCACLHVNMCICIRIGIKDNFFSKETVNSMPLTVFMWMYDYFLTTIYRTILT